MQNVEKMRLRMSSAVVAPVMASRAERRRDREQHFVRDVPLPRRALGEILQRLAQKLLVAQAGDEAGFGSAAPPGATAPKIPARRFSMPAPVRADTATQSSGSSARGGRSDLLAAIKVRP